MRTLAAKQTLIPATAHFDVMHTNERLWTHTILSFGEACSQRLLQPVVCHSPLRDNSNRVDLNEEIRIR